MITPRGIAVAGALFVLLVLGILTHYPELGFLFLVGLATLVIGLGWVLRKPRLRIDRQIEPDRVVRGDVALGLLKVGNPNSVASAPVVAYEATGDTTVTVDIERLAPGEHISTTYKLPTSRRAVIPVGPLSITRQDPFGLWRITQRVGDIRQLWVHPVTHAVAGLPSGRTLSMDGRDDDRARNGSITFHSLREYVIGDDLRRVHWRSSAKLGTLMVRESVDTSLARITLVLDTQPSSYRGDGFEEAVEVAASIGVTATSERYAVRLLTTSGESAMARGITSDSTVLLDCFAGLEVGRGGTLTQLAEGLANERRGDILVVVTGRPSPSDLSGIVAVGRRFDAGLVAMITSAEPDGSDPALPNVTMLRAPTAQALIAQWNTLVQR